MDEIEIEQWWQEVFDHLVSVLLWDPVDADTLVSDYRKELSLINFWQPELIYRTNPTGIAEELANRG